jgi:hypothetical protein
VVSLEIIVGDVSITCLLVFTPMLRTAVGIDLAIRQKIVLMKQE